MDSANEALIVQDLAVGYNGRGLLPAFDWKGESRDFGTLIGSDGGGKSIIVKTARELLEPVAESVRTSKVATGI